MSDDKNPRHNPWTLEPVVNPAMTRMATRCHNSGRGTTQGGRLAGPAGPSEAQRPRR